MTPYIMYNSTYMSRARLLIFSWHTSLHCRNYLQAQSPAPVPGGRCPVRCFACSCVQMWQVCIEYRPALLWLRQNFPPRETQTETVGRCQSCQASVSSQHICTFRNLTSNSKFRTSRWLGPHFWDGHFQWNQFSNQNKYKATFFSH